MYEKYFDEWNIEKHCIHKKEIKLYPKEREIWNLKLGVNIGSEADGKRGFYRPILILKRIGSMFLIVPMTSKGKINSPYYHTLTSLHFNDGNGDPIISSLMLSHIRTVDIRRFYKHKATLPKEEFSTIQKILREKYF